MAGRITSFLREAQFPLSIITTVIGIFVFFTGAASYWLQDFCLLPPEYYNWGFYFLAIGFIVLIMGVYYLYSYIVNKKFVLEELKTNKRSELLKRHSEIKNKVRHLPSKYKKMLKEKENELKIK